MFQPSIVHKIKILVFSILCSNSFAQIITIPIETKQNALVLQTDAENRLGIVYFGKKLSKTSEYTGIWNDHKYNDVNAAISHSVYTPSGSWNMIEPALTLIHADGNTSTDLKYVSHKAEKQGENVLLIRILLKDPVYATEIMLFYKTYFAENVIEQWSTIKNNEKGNLKMNKYASANLYFIANNFYLKHYHGGWGREMKPEETKLTAGIKTLDSKLGTRANLFQPPTFSLSFDKPATENEGKVLFGTLAWSGNFKIDFEKDSYYNLRLIAGINSHASEYVLSNNQTFKTPSFIYTYSENGKGEASRNMHQWARKYRILDGEGSRLTLLNNWEATYFDFEEQKLTGLFKDAKKLGVDMFLLDDGWFGNKYPRNDDHAGLGDWQENRKKLPNGIGYLVKEATKAGVKFGIWVEPEMVSPKSELYENHKDWVIRQPERPEHYFRNQLVLDLTNPEVQDYVFGVLDNLFNKNPELAFIKWDANATIFNAHSAYLQKQNLPQTHLYVDYVKGLYKVLERIRAKYPKIPMMLCSGGGGRVDYEALKYFTEFWLSDDTDPLERIFIQWEDSYFFPAISLCNHITDWSKVGIKYRTDVAMMGKMGYDIVVNNLSEKELLFSQNALKKYVELKGTIWHGEMYHLVNPWENPIAAMQFVSQQKDHAVMFSYLTTNRFELSFTSKPIKLEGLDANKQYKVKEINIYPDTESILAKECIYSGEYLMTIGVNPDITLKRTSVVLEINEAK
ncbi:Alpha-galactosidase AgaA [Emticicia aquatica]|uniref:Alpha-galactosidase n=1 Tax=Emticicia aquatica TaxID=1681835 RepID=A0ABM9AUQ7_9BACT|nr:alpha-galactosidase [Emticicia aquatica]CAH0997788.1 Alpha-galactosidase AgaA [Emticicia aquatica]